MEAGPGLSIDRKERAANQSGGICKIYGEPSASHFYYCGYRYRDYYLSMQATFTIAGEGPLQADLAAQARELGVADKILFPGFLSQTELRALFYQSHLFLHPSERGGDGNQEGVPNSMLEAMAGGLPIFATNHGGIPEAVEDGKSGILVGESDPDALADALLKAAADPESLTSMARGGADAVRAKFEQREQIRKLEDYYFEVMRL